MAANDINKPDVTKTPINYVEFGEPVGHTEANRPTTALEQTVNDAINELENIDRTGPVGYVTKDMTGIYDRNDSIISFDESLGEVSIAPKLTSFDVYYQGQLHQFTSTKSISLDTTVSGERYITFNENTFELEEVGDTPSFDKILTHYVYWNSNSQKFVIIGDERHGSNRDTTWHEAQHKNVGALWRSGGNVDYVLDDPANINIGISAPITFADEDIEIAITHSDTPSGDFEQILDGTAEIPVIHIDRFTENGSEVERYDIDAPTTEPFKMGTDAIAYNSISDVSNVQKDLPDNKYMTYYIVATNCIDTPIKSIQGRIVHDTLTDAQSEDVKELGISFEEIVPLYQIIVKTDYTITENPYKITIEEVNRLTRDALYSSPSFYPTEHDSLSGRSDPNQHPISAITNLDYELGLRPVGTDLGSAASKDVEDDGGTVVESQNIGTAARENDNRYVHRSNNLSDIPSPEQARSNLVTYSKSESDHANVAFSFILDDGGTSEGSFDEQTIEDYNLVTEDQITDFVTEDQITDFLSETEINNLIRKKALLYN